MQLLLYCLHITGQQRCNRGGPATREATDDDIKRCDADGNPTLGGAQPADVRRCSVIGDGEGDGDGVT